MFDFDDVYCFYYGGGVIGVFYWCGCGNVLGNGGGGIFWYDWCDYFWFVINVVVLFFVGKVLIRNCFESIIIRRRDVCINLFVL